MKSFMVCAVVLFVVGLCLMALEGPTAPASETYDVTVPAVAPFVVPTTEISYTPSCCPGGVCPADKAAKATVAVVEGVASRLGVFRGRLRARLANLASLPARVASVRRASVTVTAEVAEVQTVRKIAPVRRIVARLRARRG